MRASISPMAERDIESIGDYIARDNPVRAVTFVREIRGQCERVAGNPHGYRQRQELGAGIRSCTHGSYVIFFAVEADALHIVRVLHGARNLAALFGQDIDDK